LASLGLGIHRRDAETLRKLQHKAKPESAEVAEAAEAHGSEVSASWGLGTGKNLRGAKRFSGPLF
jgi:hypothetical protein